MRHFSSSRLAFAPLFLAVIIGGVFVLEKHNRAFASVTDRGVERIEDAIPVRIATTTPPHEVRIPILIYHSIRPEASSESLRQKEFSLTPAEFEEQLKYLQNNGYTAISLDDLVNDVVRGTTAPVAKPVVITFDDGWRDQYLYAFPLLKKYHDTATFYVYTKPIGAYPAFLTWDEVKEMDAAGMTIGDHTVSHAYLSKLTPAELKAEVLGGKKAIEEHLGKPVVHFASPFGYTNEMLVVILRDAGFKTGRTSYRGVYHSKDDLLHLSGFYVHRDMHEFEWILKYSEQRAALFLKPGIKPAAHS